MAKLLNFTKAAATLHISQPAVTKHIKELEQNYKVVLFDRQPNALTLTDAGKLLYKYATAIMEQYDLLEFDIGTLNDKVTGDLRIAATPTIAQYTLPPTLASFNQRMPDISIHLINGNSSQVEQMLQDKVADIGFIENKMDHSNLQYAPYLKDEIVLATSFKNNYLRKELLNINDLYQLQFVVAENNFDTNNFLSGQLRKAGITPEKLKMNMRFSSSDSIMPFLANSNYFAFISLQATMHGPGFNSLKTVSVNGLETIRTFHIALCQDQPSLSVALFTRFIRANMQ